MENSGDEKVRLGDLVAVKSEVAKCEEATLAFWQTNKIFEKTLEQTKTGKPFVFYDGPPFATGLPHYGHILAGTIKDVIPRYQTMLGRHVPRRWGWDCHGLPIENIIEAELGLKTKKDIEDLGIGKFNQAAREAVLRYAADWKKIIPRLGRFVDMDNDYRTMDASYSESVWGVFKTLYNKGLIYEGYKSMPLCPRCETTLSNFEVNQGYKDITDISVYVKFQLIEDSPSTGSGHANTYVLAWTTTPWTLPGNAALAINPNINYVKVLQEGNYYIVARDLADKAIKDGYEVVAEFSGKDLIGKEYKSVFDYYQATGKIYAADFVTTDSGTGVVHIAPAFGEDDMTLGKANNLPFIQHVGTDGKFKPEVTDFAGLVVKPKDRHQDTDIEIIKNLAHRGLLFAKEKIVHSYPHCWRCDTPLLNYAASSWFVKVTDFKDKLVAVNNKITWVPKHIKDGRFGNWLAGARDWAISRSRFWGAPLPVWKCADCKKIKVVGNIGELVAGAPTQFAKIIFVRHGESEKNVLGIWDSSSGKYPLTVTGVNQAKAAVKKLTSEKISAIYTSPVLRAKQTADIIAVDLKIKPIEVDGLREVAEGEWEGKNSEQVKDLPSRQTYIKVTDPDEHYRAKRGGTGESWADVEVRMAKAVVDIAKKHAGQTVVVVTHQGAMAYALRALGNLSLFDTICLYNNEAVSGFAIPYQLVVDVAHGKTIDLHRPYIDEIKLKCACGQEMKRVPEVFDCWFESGSMPYIQKNSSFPANFIAEGLDQTRGWFYSLLVLGVALFGKSPYKNVICTGLILAEDGQKMSKKLKNYPDPMELVAKYGADAIRYYMINSPIVRGEDLNFSEKGVDEVYKKIILRLGNVVALYQMYANEKVEAKSDSKNVLDQWMIARLNETVAEVTKALDSYELDKAVRPFDLLVDDLSTWYVRRSRERFKSSDTIDKQQALQTTKYILLELSKLLAPIMPFLAERIYRDLGGDKESVHLESWSRINQPSFLNKLFGNKEPKVIAEMALVRNTVSLGLEARAKAKIKVRQPLANLKIKNNLFTRQSGGRLAEYLNLIAEEVNVKKVVVDENLAEEVLLDITITPELEEEGRMRDLLREVQDLRKTSGLNPSDRVRLVASQLHYELASKFKTEFLRVAGVVEITLDPSTDIRIEKV